jgi:hypothetical protein
VPPSASCGRTRCCRGAAACPLNRPSPAPAETGGKSMAARVLSIL